MFFFALLLPQVIGVLTGLYLHGKISVRCRHAIKHANRSLTAKRILHILVVFDIWKGWHERSPCFRQGGMPAG